MLLGGLIKRAVRHEDRLVEAADPSRPAEPGGIDYRGLVGVDHARGRGQRGVAAPPLGELNLPRRLEAEAHKRVAHAFVRGVGIEGIVDVLGGDERLVRFLLFSRLGPQRGLDILLLLGLPYGLLGLDDGQQRPDGRVGKQRYPADHDGRGEEDCEVGELGLHEKAAEERPDGAQPQAEVAIEAAIGPAIILHGPGVVGA